MSRAFEDFLAALRMRESSDDYTAVNTLGYLGAYQFGEAALVDLGFVRLDANPYDNDFGGGFTGKLGVLSASDFLDSPDAQDAAVAEWMPRLWRYLEAVDLDTALGHVIDGVHLTASGLLAGAHLLGAGGVRDWVRSGGSLDLRDGYGTSIRDYFSDFGGFEVPFVRSATLMDDDALSGWDGADEIAALRGDDTILGRRGDDHLSGGPGRDVLRGNPGADTLQGGRGADHLFGVAGRDTLRGNAGADTLKGGKGRDALFGGAQNDRLDGGAQRDRLNGQAGDDILFGDDGPDRFIFRKGGGADIVADFTDDVDAIRLFRLGTLDAIQDLAEQSGDDVVFDFGDGDVLTVLNTSLDALGDDLIA